MKSTFLATL